MKPTEEQQTITGEQVEQKDEPLPFNEWVHIILQSHDIKQSDNEYEKTRVTAGDGYARIYAADLVIVIQPEEEVMHISTLNQVLHTYSHDFCEWDNFDAGTFPFMGLLYVWWLDHLKPALFEIIQTLETSEQVEQSLEEKVREILEPAADISELKVTDHSVEFLDYSKPPMWYFVTSSEISYVPQDAPKSRNTFTIREYRNNYGETPEINAALPKVAALLTAQPESEQTLEEAVRGILDKEHPKGVTIPDLKSCSSECVVLQYGTGSTETVFADGTVDYCGRGSKEIEKYSVIDAYRTILFDISAEIRKHPTRSTKPSYSDLEQRVEELEKEIQSHELQNGNLIIDCVEYNKTISAQFDRIEELERENASLLDKFGPIDQAEQQAAEVETRFQKLAKRAERIADLLIQLNEEIL